MTSNFIDFQSDSLSVILSDFPSSSIVTSFLFNHALSISRSNGCTTIIRPDRLSELPLRLDDSNDQQQQPSLALIRKIEFVYLIDRSDFIDYATKLYDSSIGVPACFLVESIDRYSMMIDNRLSGLASILALLHDLGQWIMEKRKIDQQQGDRLLLSPVLCSISIDRSEHEKIIRVIEIYTKSIWRLHSSGDEDESKFFYYRHGEYENRSTLLIDNENRRIVSLT